MFYIIHWANRTQKGSCGINMVANIAGGVFSINSTTLNAMASTRFCCAPHHCQILIIKCADIIHLNSLSPRSCHERLRRHVRFIIMRFVFTTIEIRYGDRVSCGAKGNLSNFIHTFNKNTKASRCRKKPFSFIVKVQCFFLPLPRRTV